MDPQTPLSTLPTDVLKTLFSRAFEGITISEDARVIYANEEFAAMLGWTPSEVVGRMSHELAKPGADALAVQDTMKSNGVRSYTVSGVHKNGKTVYAEIRSLPYFWNGRHLRLSAFRDITESVEVQNSLRASEQRYRTLIESAEQGIWQIDADINTVFVNSKLAGLLQYTPEEMIGRSLYSFVPVHLHETLRANIVSRKSGIREVIESRFLRKDGTMVWMTNSVAPILGPAGEFRGALGFLSDISAQKEAEAKLAELRGQMLFSSQASLLGEIANGIAHEINNPLLVIRSYTDVLREGLERDIDRKQLLASVNHIDTTVSRITQIVRSLAVHTRASNPEPFYKMPVETLVSDSIGLCDGRLKKAGITLLRKTAAAGLELECRSVPVSQILLNLLNNAADAVEAQSDKWIRVAVEEQEDDVLIGVEDSGPGVPVAEQDRIMQAFFTTKPPHRGTGLGLSISRKIAESHGGTLRLDTKAACTRFELRLPKRQVPKANRNHFEKIAPLCVSSLGLDFEKFCAMFLG